MRGLKVTQKFFKATPPNAREIIASQYVRVANRLLWAAPQFIGAFKFFQSTKVQTVAAGTRHLSGPLIPKLSHLDWVVVCLLRDAAAYLPVFLDHYRKLGAAHFIFMDNGSSDSTCAYLAQQADVSALQCTLPFAVYETEMRNFLLEKFAYGRWAIVADMDELFDFPNSHKIQMSEVLSYLDSRQYNAVLTPMLDLFSEKPVLHSPETEDFRRTHRYYDLTAIRKFKYLKNHTLLKGGVRSTAFGCDAILLVKHSLIKYHRGMFRPDPHWLHGAKIADITAVLLHYKFIKGFEDRVADATRRKNHYQQSKEYVAYQRALEKNPALSLHSSKARPLSSLHDLVSEGFLKWKELK